MWDLQPCSPTGTTDLDKLSLVILEKGSAPREPGVAGLWLTTVCTKSKVKSRDTTWGTSSYLIVSSGDPREFPCRWKTHSFSTCLSRTNGVPCKHVNSANSRRDLDASPSGMDILLVGVALQTQLQAPLHVEPKPLPTHLC